MGMDTTAALLLPPLSKSATVRPVGARYADYRSSSAPVREPETVRAFTGVLIAVPLGALLWVSILWLIL